MISTVSDRLPQTPLAFSYEIDAEPIPSSRPELPIFGQHFTDHMVQIAWDSGTGWHNPRITRYRPLLVDPAAAVLHYGLEIFEGLKAYRHPDGSVHLFRPEANAARFQRSAERLALPALDAGIFVASLEALVALDADWIPSEPDSALYLRPFLIATDPYLGLRVPRSASFVLIASPARPYFTEDRPLEMWLSREYSRAGKGGTGAAKCGGNYASSLLATALAAQHGCDQVVFTDSETGSYVEEAGNMNLFLVQRDNTLLTPPVAPASEGGTVLEGITRDSIITLARAEGHRVEERRISVDEWAEGVQTGDIVEAFAVGTAAIVAPIGRLHTADTIVPSPTEGIGQVTAKLRRRLTDIQFGRDADEHAWMRRISV